MVNSEITTHAIRPSDEASSTAWDLVAQVTDPEIPVLTIEDLGILREVHSSSDGTHVVLTPTYSGCPAIDQMRDDVREKLTESGYQNIDVTFTLSPAWTTDWMSEEGKRKLEQYGIAPPNGKSSMRRGPIPVQIGVKCPRCHSPQTREVSRFGSTLCKAHYECLACLEPFDFFKVH